MSVTHEAEVLFISRRKSTVYYRNYQPSDAAAATDSTAPIGFQAQFGFLPGSDFYYFFVFRSFISDNEIYRTTLL